MNVSNDNPREKSIQPEQPARGTVQIHSVRAIVSIVSTLKTD